MIHPANCTPRLHRGRRDRSPQRCCATAQHHLRSRNPAPYNTEIFGRHDAKQAPAYGYSGVLGLNIQLVTVATRLTAPVTTRARPGQGNTATAKGAARMLAQAISPARAVGVKGQVLRRVDSTYHGGRSSGPRSARMVLGRRKDDQDRDRRDHQHPPRHLESFSSGGLTCGDEGGDGGDE